MKRCTKCGIEKPLTEFYAMAGMRDGHRNDCKQCNLAAKAARHRQNPEPGRARARRWQRENPERVAAQRAAARGTGKRQVQNRRSYLKRTYGLTLEEYEHMLRAQGRKCAICRARPRDDISLHVDHDHETGEIRGLTCFKCNNAIGDLGDVPARIEREIEYLVSGVDSLNDEAILITIAKQRAWALRKAA